MNELAGLALLAGACGPRAEIADGLRRVACCSPSRCSALERGRRRVARAFAFVGRMFVVGRGLEYSTAREVALKLTETCRVAAEPLTATDLSHGPVAALDPLFPVWTIASETRPSPPVEAAAACEPQARCCSRAAAPQPRSWAPLRAARAAGPAAAVLAAPLGRSRSALRGGSRT